MTTEEKLKYFLAISIESANKKSTAMLTDYQNALTEIFERHKQDAIQKAELQITLGIASLEHEKNKAFSKEQIQIKKEFSQLQEDLEETLFSEVKELLDQYMTTPDYQKLLIRQILEAKHFAKSEEMILYIDPIDSDKLHDLEDATHTQLTISQYSFMGGIRAIIPSRNLLIDHSFETKFYELKDAFTFINK